MKKVPKGFTLAERLITLAIISLLLMGSLASWHHFRQKNTLTILEKNLTTAIQFARLTALSNNKPVYIAAINPDDSKNWSHGMRLYDAGNHKMLYQWTWNKPYWIITWQGFGASHLQIAAHPKQAASNGQIIIKNPQTGEESRLVVNRLGRVRKG